MTAELDALLTDEPAKWVSELPEFQRKAIQELVKAGRSYDEIAGLWLTATAENTFRFGASTPLGSKTSFLDSVKKELRAFLCGDRRYKKERDGLFGGNGVTRTTVVSALSVAIAPHVGMAAPVLVPIITLVIASMGKVAINAWCKVNGT